MHRAARHIESCEGFWITIFDTGLHAEKNKVRWPAGKARCPSLPFFVCDRRPPAYHRSVGKPTTRWQDDIANYAKSNWRMSAQDATTCGEHKLGFFFAWEGGSKTWMLSEGTSLPAKAVALACGLAGRDVWSHKLLSSFFLPNVCCNELGKAPGKITQHSL